jgi:hypothetical protein
MRLQCSAPGQRRQIDPVWSDCRAAASAVRLIFPSSFRTAAAAPRLRAPQVAGIVGILSLAIITFFKASDSWQLLLFPRGTTFGEHEGRHLPAL